MLEGEARERLSSLDLNAIPEGHEFRIGESVRLRGNEVANLESAEMVDEANRQIRIRDFAVHYPDAVRRWGLPRLPTTTPEDDLLQETAESRQREFIESFKNYGILLGTMSPEELAVEIGSVFPVPKQAALISSLAARLIALENETKK